jgi:hypothetical protein
MVLFGTNLISQGREIIICLPVDGRAGTDDLCAIRNVADDCRFGQSRRSEIVRAKDNVSVYSGA